MAHEHALLVVVLAAAALIRFGTLGVKSYWLDEGTTIQLLQGGVGFIFSGLTAHDPTPPLYFVLAWAWAHIAGYGEFALRSISAAAGLLTVAICYLTARRLFGARAALITAALLAVNPMLVWYSQEARAYALLALFAAASLFFFVGLWLEPSRRDLAGWVVSCVLMVVTHYFGIFLVLSEAALLLWTLRTRVPPKLLLGISATAAVAIVALAITASFRSSTHLTWIGSTGLMGRVVSIPGAFLSGFEAPQRKIFAFASAALVLVAFTWLRRERSGTRNRIAVLVATGALTIALPVAAALVGRDYITPRNVITALLPLWIALGAALAATSVSRLVSAAVASALVGIGFAAVALTAWTPKYHYQDWRNVSRALGPARSPRAIVLAPNIGFPPLQYYQEQTMQAVSRSAPPVKEVDVVATVALRNGETDDPYPPVPDRDPVVPGMPFKLVQVIRERRFTLARFQAAKPVVVNNAIELLAGFGESPVGVGIEPGPPHHKAAAHD